MTIYLRILARLIMRGAILPLSQYTFMAKCSVKHRDNFTCTFIPQINEMAMKHFHLNLDLTISPNGSK